MVSWQIGLEYTAALHRVESLVVENWGLRPCSVIPRNGSLKDAEVSQGWLTVVSGKKLFPPTMHTAARGSVTFGLTGRCERRRGSGFQR